ncbi:hypothetical protein [Actinoallomurus iriomotensis]|nr:hypothetical protein [Actinoallomurus iriomotensis]
MMRDLIAAFSAAARDQMKAAGWRKRAGDIFTYDLGNGYLAWLGLNTSTKRHPLWVNPVMGVRCDPLERLLDEWLVDRSRGIGCTVRRSIGYLTPANSFLELEVETVEDATPAAERLRTLVEAYGMPFARDLADDERFEIALRDFRLVANVSYSPFHHVAFLFLRGRREEAQQVIERDLAEYETNDGALEYLYRAFVQQLVTRFEDSPSR